MSTFDNYEKLNFKLREVFREVNYSEKKQSPISYGPSDSLATMGGGLRGPLDINGGIIAEPILLKSICY